MDIDMICSSEEIANDIILVESDPLRVVRRKNKIQSCSRMFRYPNSVRLHTKGKTYEQIAADPKMGEFVENIFPLSNTIPNITYRSTLETLGKGSFGRVDLETLKNDRSEVATKYFLSDKTFSQNVSEIAVLKYLRDRPNVAQYIGVSSANAQDSFLPFPAVIMGKARSSLTPRNLYKSWSDIHATIVDILHGFYVLHSLGIAHRDIKPDNMLRTNYGETWITDFGNSHYISPFSPLEDMYTGTYWYCSPEMLFKSLAPDEAYTYNWFAHDCWAVGASLVEVLTGHAIFPAAHRVDILRRIFAIKGTPTSEDGEVYSLFQHSGFAPSAGGLSVDGFVRSRLAFSPPAEEELDVLLEMINGFLIYDPKKRLSILGALQLLGLPPDPIARPLLQVKPEMPPDSYAMLAKECDFLHAAVCADYRYDLSLPRNTRHIVLDRACIYMYSFFLAYPGTFHPVDVRAVAMTSLILASCLFSSDGDGILPETLPYFSTVSPERVHRYLTMFFQADIPFFGTTILDTILERDGSKSLTRQQTFGFVNLVCYQKMLYQLYHDRLEELIGSILNLIRFVDLRSVEYSLLFRKQGRMGSGESLLQKLTHDIEEFLVEEMKPDEDLPPFPEKTNGGVPNSRKARKARNTRKARRAKKQTCDKI